MIKTRPPEAELYKSLWEHDQYRITAPGEQCVLEFINLLSTRKNEWTNNASLLDLGCGTGRAGLILSKMGFNVTLVDFASNCLDPDVRVALGDNLKFFEADISKPLPITANFGFCTDVLEHIPPVALEAVLDNCLHACKNVYFQIATDNDVMGALVGHPLHLSVHSYKWWLKKFQDRNCTIHWSTQHDTVWVQGKDGVRELRKLGRCAFYVSAWVDGQAIVDVGVLNVSAERIQQNVACNVSQGWQQVEPYETNDDEVLILGGGPSLSDFAQEIREKRTQGAKLITLNGAYNWCLDHGITPSAQVVVDAREFNARFTHPVVDDCKYLIASQVDPEVLAGLPKERTFLWHTSADQIQDVLSETYKVWYPIPGGSTVLLRAIPLLRMLGFHKFHIYGCDSCLIEDSHHAFSQPENDGGMVIPTEVGGRIFRCYPWMIAQGQEFLTLVRLLGNEFDMEVHGDGMLAWMLKHAAAMDEAAEERENALC